MTMGKRSKLLACLAFVVATSVAIVLWQSSRDTLNDRFIHAAQEGNVELAGQLLQSGANIDACGSWEDCDTALLKAVEFNRIDMVKFLVEKGARLTNGANSALGTAAYFGHVEIVKYLLARGAVLGDNKEINANLNIGLHQKHEDEIIKLLFPNSPETEIKK